MKAVIIESFGNDDKLKLANRPEPKPKEGEVLIRLRSAGVGIWDEMVIQGEFAPQDPKFPLTPGWDGAGVISAIGAGVSDFKPGDEVFFYEYSGKDPSRGTWAEQIVVHAKNVSKKPKSLSMEQAGGLPIIGLTAFQVLTEQLGLKAGQSLLITNGAGGVGSCAIQLAKVLGAKVIALASESSHAYLKELGADWVFDYHKNFTGKIEELFGAGVDCIFDDVGKKETVEKAMPCLKAGGIFCTIVDRFPELERKDVENKFHEAHASGSQLALLARLADEGKLKVHIDQVYPLDKASEALRRVESGHVHGKVVLKVA